MNAQTHDSAVAPVRPSWLLPVLIIAGVTVGLVITGVLPSSVFVYVALGGCALMHLFGHRGHGYQTSSGGGLAERAAAPGKATHHDD